MILGYHVIITTYGFWLPNDPRGSWSDWVASWELFRYGPATKTDTRTSVAGRSHDRAARLAAKTALKYPPVEFTGIQARAVGFGFKTSLTKGKVTCWACSILPDHAHIVLARHRCDVEVLVNFLKGQATKQLLVDGLHPLANFKNKQNKTPTCWAHKHWQVFLDSPADIERSIAYVDYNPLKEGKPAQRWPFVSPYHGV